MPLQSSGTIFKLQWAPTASCCDGSFVPLPFNNPMHRVLLHLQGCARICGHLRPCSGILCRTLLGRVMSHLEAVITYDELGTATL